MKNLFQILTLVFFCLFLGDKAYSQAKKPTIMIVPNDNWCIKNNYLTKFDEAGTLRTVPDYEAALQDNSELVLVINKLNELMADRGFPLKNLESVFKTIKSEMAEDALLTSKDGAGIAESPFERLKKTAKADIIMQISWTVNQVGPKRSITFNLQGLDAYTDKQVAGASGTGQQSFSAELVILLEEAVIAYLDNFNSQLQKHFEDMFENGREIVIRIKRFDSWQSDLETEYGGEELSALIEKWLAKNTVKGRFSTTEASENNMYFEQVRIPLFDNNGASLDARGFTKGLQSFLKSEPYKIPNKLMTKGLGSATIVLGGK